MLNCKYIYACLLSFTGRFIPSTTEMSFTWKGFLFVNPILLYQWGIGTSSKMLDNILCSDLVCILKVTLRRPELLKTMGNTYDDLLRQFVL